jgi:hypothetical protein
MSKKRSPTKWMNQFLINKKIFESISELSLLNDDNLIQDACVAYRNPVVFDNQVSDAIYELPFYVVGNVGDDMVKDHLIGMSNIVLYIFKNKIYEKWSDVNDFINTQRALQVLLPIPKWLNNKKSYKSWQFDIDNINSCIFWNEKLKNEGIFQIKHLDGTTHDVDSVWNEWYQQFKKYL